MKYYKGLLPELQLKYKKGEMHRFKVASSQDVYDALKTMYDADTIDYLESSIVLFLNRANNTIAWVKVSQGGTNSTVMDGKVIFTTALKVGASALILSHNHPSGNLKPSAADIKVTEELSKVGKYINLDVLDHLIITSEGYYSFADEGDI